MKYDPFWLFSCHINGKWENCRNISRDSYGHDIRKCEKRICICKCCVVVNMPTHFEKDCPTLLLDCFACCCHRKALFIFGVVFCRYFYGRFDFDRCVVCPSKYVFFLPLCIFLPFISDTS
jgi:hypothetical protein